ncbi:hypothetical protein GQ602_001558 [Ophiocordyceps camponoti-floridani]|uniref:Uncharacterized protein n=1 Tax=Ophiocordyceps camponoti-floridani TaxID=2030778 RepID=A0A8H4QEB0_9HYPO|nr:hypothetical protein GQ602_001558 [Ophiocordyceps camponoti-floridani]
MKLPGGLPESRSSSTAAFEPLRLNLRRSLRLDAVFSVLTKRECGFEECAKSVSSTVTNVAIVLGIGIPVVVGAIVLLFLHRRNVRRLKMEDDRDPNVGLDFGLDDSAQKTSSKRKSIFGADKTAHKPGQLSMDMNLSSPYLLPPGIQHSHDSIHSLARTFPNEQDPYRTIKEYSVSETGSVRSFKPSRDSPLPNKPNSAHGRMGPVGVQHPPLMNSAPRSPASDDAPPDPFANPKVPESSQPIAGSHEPIRPLEPIVPEIGTVAYPDDNINSGFEIPDVYPHDATIPQHGRPYPAPDGTPRFEHGVDANIGVAHAGDELHMASRHDAEPDGMGYSGYVPKALPPGPHASSNDAYDATPEFVFSHDGYDQPHEDYSLDGEQAAVAMAYHDGDQHGRSMEQPPVAGAHSAQGQQSSLGVPRQQNKRMSVGFRPLPPDEVTESDDPEYRANRIRSFYKEYFDDSKETPPPMPSQRGRAQYDDDYESNFLGDAAYYDAETNAFVMPYAQPVTRRAMTPPPAGRFRGPGPRGPHGSMSGMPRRPRAGSAVVPRPGSSASAGMRGPPRKRLPPPTALKTLPTPSKLRDDSFAIMNAIDFAPPETFEERAAGRSQSPLGERRPYQLKKPVASPLATAFDDLAVLPSPHCLRKSSTFTNLDFAPPKKFKDPETASDAGSIRSNRSGISAVQLGAIRSGAGRVSRLPGDTVFTAAAMSDQLKPNWGMRS